jgi:hypothetical protein
LDAYRQDYLRTLQDIEQIFRQELLSFSLLQEYTSKMESTVSGSYKSVLNAEEEFSVEVRSISE